MPATPPSDPAAQHWSARAQTIAALLELYRERNPTAQEYIHLRNQLRSAYKGRRVSEQTVRTLLRKFRADGLDGLERKRHRDLGQSTLPPLLREYIRDLLITTRLSKQKVLEKAQKYAQSILDRPDLAISYDQILFIDQAIPQHLRTLGQEGLRAYRDRHEIAEQFEAEYANQLAHADNHLLDFFVKDPDTGREYRPWISVLLDDYSRAILGFYLSKRDPGSRGVALAFRHALLRKPQDAWVMRGIMANVYFDHGKEYLSEHITGVCLHLGTHIMTHEEYHPRAKGKLEQWFDTFEEDCLSGEDGYVGSDLKKRPKNPKVRYTIEELRDIIRVWILEKYHERVHSETKISPRKRWLASAQQHAIRPVDESNERHLDFLLHSRERKISKLGVRYNDVHYLDPDYTLENHIGEPVMIYFDPWNPAQLYVYGVEEHTGQWAYLCTAYPRVKHLFDDEERKEVAAGARARRKPKHAEVQASRQRVKQTEKQLQRQAQSRSSPNAPAVPPADPAPMVPPATVGRAAPGASTAPAASPARVVRLSDLLKEYDDGQEQT